MRHSVSEPEVPDPLEQAPHVVWYLRPPSGGQYGPATRELMRAWLAEGRVTPDSQVWREGWRDWKSAGDVFPESAFPQFQVPDAVSALNEILAEPGVGPSEVQHHGPIDSTSQLAQLLVILSLIALGVAILGAVYFWARFS